MRGAQIRGFLVFAAVAVAIGVLWTRIDEAPVNEFAVVTTTTSTTSTTSTTTTTITPEQAILEVCDRSAVFVAEVATIGEDAGPGPVAQLAHTFWSEIEEKVPDDIRVEVTAVVDYYDSYLEVGEPFEFSTVDIIIAGDKERLEQLITRPAAGLVNARGFIQFVCGLDVPDQPRMSASAYASLEDRLLDSDPLE